jgi:uncharacterized protein (TIGR02145 family)
MFTSAFTDLDTQTDFWSSTYYDAVYPYYMLLLGNDNQIFIIYYSKSGGLSIRCIKD